GIVLALGMLVDSGLVVVENIGRHLEHGLETREAVVRGVDEVKTPVLASTLTTVAAFIPLLFLSGNMGAFILGLPLTVIFALTGSLLVAVTVIPLLCFTLWRGQRAVAEIPEPDSRALGIYTELVKGALRHRWITLALAFVAFVASLAVVPVLGFQLFPKAEKDFFLINVRLPWEANLATTDQIAARVEDVLRDEDEVRDYTVNIGMGGPLIYYNILREQKRSSYAEVLVNLGGGVSADRYVPQLQEKLRQIAGASIEPRILEQGPLGDAAIQIRVMGPDLDTLAGIAVDIGDKVREVPGLVDLRSTLGERTPRLALDVDSQKAGLLGVDTFSFAQTVWTALEGTEATKFRTEQEEIPVVVRLDPDSVREVSSLDRLQIPSRTGASVGFSEVASVRETSGFARVTHRNGQRSVVVECDASGRLADQVLGDIRKLLDDYELPGGYEMEFGGEHEERNESFAGLGQALVLALLLIYALLAIQFNSFVQPMVILFTVPLGVIGAIFGLLMTGNPFGFMAFIGIVSLTGIIINDSIVLTDFANYLQRVEGKRMLEALLEAGRMRFRPVVLTSVTTIGGLTPLAIWGGSLWSPLACAVIFGLLGATVLILIVLPVIYSLLVRAAEGRREFRLMSVV
ncbi:MAG: efflux RND transporter permease subunit, partial [bacterium]|nr:efflux RND transporter permease subunit [bacterium]